MDPTERTGPFLRSMHYNQRLNTIPGITQLTGKKSLGRNLARAEKMFPSMFRKITPQTFQLPEEWMLLADFLKSKRKTVIVKPNGGGRGEGIFMTRSITHEQLLRT